MNQVIERVREELKASADEKTKKSFQRFFKEEVAYYGVKTGTVGRIAKKYWDEVKSLGKKEIFSLCEELYRSNYTEEAFVAAFWLPNLVEKLEPCDLAEYRNKLVHPFRAIDRERLSPPVKGHGLDKPKEAEEVVGMPVGDKHSID